MEITEVRIKLMDDPNDRLRAFCSITFDGAFVIRDLKIIQGAKGSFVAMPSRKLTDRCPRCGCKNHLRSCFCNQCGARLNEDRATKDEDGRAKLYADIAHPINSLCREQIQNKVLEAFDAELELSQQPGYTCTYDDFGEESYASLHETEAEERQTIPMTRTTADGNVHRIESAQETPSGPHSPAMRSREPAAAENLKQSAMDDDNFGEGVV